jgi:DnaK suppressor protein
MYNPRLFSVPQELKMPAKKTASKQRKKAAATGKKAAARKTAARKTASRKSTATKKKASTVNRKKVATRKKAPPKKSAAGKAAGTKTVSQKATASKNSASRKSLAQKGSTKRSVAAPAGRNSSGARSASKKREPERKFPERKLPIRPMRSRASLLSGPIHGIEPYKPKRGEEYMSSDQLQHFRKILTSWKRELMYEVDRTVHHMQDEAANFPDPNDRATQESEFGLELRTRDRERKLLRKIDSALTRIEDGTYGYCDETGEEIGLKRLEARPVATLCLEAQEPRELAERQFRDRDDRYR